MGVILMRNDLEIREQYFSDLTRLFRDAIKYLEDKTTSEIYIKSDGNLWIREIGRQEYFTGIVFKIKEVHDIINFIASFYDQYISENNPTISEMIPGYDARFIGGIIESDGIPSIIIRKNPNKLAYI
jgi:type IV secretory pathway ATPase VirB11/archaellum biosynthesis ATPase